MSTWCIVIGKGMSNGQQQVLVYDINTLRPRQNGRHFADDTFNHIFANENVKISIRFSLKFVLKGPINNIPALVQIMAWRRPGDKPLSEPVMVSLLTDIYVTRPQWVNALRPRENGRHFAEDIFKCIFLCAGCVFWSKFHWNLFSRVPLIVSQHWLR